MRKITLLIALVLPLVACAQPYYGDGYGSGYGYGYGYRRPNPYWARQREEPQERRREASVEHHRDHEEPRRQREAELDHNYGR